MGTFARPKPHFAKWLKKITKSLPRVSNGTIRLVPHGPGSWVARAGL